VQSCAMLALADERKGEEREKLPPSGVPTATR
jgi:hypothetical protein